MIRFLLVPSHRRIGGNKYVAYLANLSSNFRSKENQNGDIQMKTINNKILIDDATIIARQICMDIWSRQYLNNTTGEHYKQFFPTINKEITTNANRSETMFRLQTGHCRLNFHLYRLGQHPTGLCDHCNQSRTVKHHILDCTKYYEARKKLKSFLFKHNIPYDLVNLLTNKLATGHLLQYISDANLRL